MSFRRDGKKLHIESQEWLAYIAANQERFDALSIPDCIKNREIDFWDFVDLGYYPYYQHHEQIATISTNDLPHEQRRIILRIVEDRLRHEPGRYFTKNVDMESYVRSMALKLGLQPDD